MGWPSSPDESLVEGALDVVLCAYGLQLAQVVVEVLFAVAGVRVVDLYMGLERRGPFKAVVRLI